MSVHAPAIPLFRATPSYDVENFFNAWLHVGDEVLKESLTHTYMSYFPETINDEITASTQMGHDCSTNSNNSPNSGIQMTNNAKVCRNCGKTGHSRKECKACWGCGLLGHTRRDCPTASTVKNVHRAPQLEESIIPRTSTNSMEDVKPQMPPSHIRNTKTGSTIGMWFTGKNVRKNSWKSKPIARQRSK
mmetsp:Transcript_36440/g.46762  ORF Transcript_36440/g.46762 Transcript_36440/m.46762 type:complete len:189 (+) Transcript_36440:268-834(+)